MSRLPLADDHPLVQHRRALGECRACPAVIPPVVSGPPVPSDIYFIGQAPGAHEGELGKPFAWTAGKRLFQWFASIGASEDAFRERVYIAATIRCFPGKATSGGGDRVPSRAELAACSRWMRNEIELLRPKLVIAVGRLAIERVSGTKVGPLEAVVGPLHRGTLFGHDVEWIALPHPSGLSAWHKVEPGRTLLARSLETLASHAVWRATFELP